jgi:hypothetical protein
MSVAERMPIARRSFVAAFAGALALAGIAALEVPKVFPGLFARGYPPTSFDDLLALLPDRENAVRLGAVLTGDRTRTGARQLAARLRNSISGHSLARAIAGDLAQDRLIEAQGWLLPDTLAELCTLAAMVEPA